MQPNRWIFAIVAAVAVAICFFVTNPLENRTEIQQQLEQRKKQENESNLLRDHRNLWTLLNAIRLQSGFLTGELKSEDVVNDVWGHSVASLLDLDLDQLLKDLWHVSDALDLTDMGSQQPINLSTIARGINGIVDMKEKERVLKNGNQLPILPEDVFTRIKKQHDWKELSKVTTASLSALRISNVKETTEVHEQNHIGSLTWKETYEVLRRVHLDVKNSTANVNDVYEATKKKLDSVIDQATKLTSDTPCVECESELSQAMAKFNLVKELLFSICSQHKAHQKVQWLDKIAQSFGSAGRKPSKERLEMESDQFLARVFRSPVNLTKLINATRPIEKYEEKLKALERTITDVKSLPIAMRNLKLMYDQSTTVKKQLYSIFSALEQYTCFKNHTIKSFNWTMVAEEFQKWRADVDDTLRRYAFNPDFSVFADYQKFRDEAIKIFDQPRDHQKNLDNMVKKYDRLSQMETSAIAIDDMVSFFDHYEPKKRNNKPFMKFKKWIETTKFVNPSCDTDFLELDPIIEFDSFVQNLLKLQEENPIADLIEELITPMIPAQEQLSSLHKTANRIQKRFAMFSVDARQLAKVFRYEGERIQDVGRGVRYLERMFEWVEHGNLIENLTRKADEVIAEADTITVRSANKYRIMDVFEDLKKDEKKIQNLFHQIKNLQRMHSEGDWHNLTDVSKIYDAAGDIQKDFDWEKFDHFERTLDRFPDEYFNRSSLMQVAREDARKLASLNIDLRQAQVAFRKTSEALKTLDSRLETFDEWTKPKPVKGLVVSKDYGFVAMVWIVGFVILAVLIAYHLSVTMIIRRKRSVKSVEEKEFEPSAQTREHALQMLQECRLEINKRGKQRLTRLFWAVLDGRLDLVIALARRGAALDAVCGPKARTALHEAAAIGDAYIVRALLDHGANQHVRDIDGKKPMGLCTKIGKKNHVPGILAGFYSRKIERVIPKVKRDFYVLIVERPKFAKELVDLLPKRLDVVYGYRVGEVDLNDFTHFIIDPEEDGGTDLPLDLDKLIHYECLAKPGMIVTTKWLNACLDNPSAVDEDYKYALTDLSFEGLVHEGKLTEIKNDIHRLRPPLLAGATITIPPTENRVMEDDFDHWVRIIEAFGGKYADEPFPSTEQEVLFHQKRSKDAPRIHPSIVLIFPDTILDERWVIPENHISLIGAGWLPESIARYELIRPDHGILRYEPDWRDLQVLFERGPRYDRMP